MTGLPDLWTAAWDRFGADGADPIATFGTWGAEGPQMRSVVLRGADRAAGTLTVYADLFSTKIAELRADPRAGLHLWDPQARLHLRATGIATVESGPALGAVWDSLSPFEQSQYGMTPPPGRVIDGPTDYHRSSAFEAFARITLNVAVLDVVRLARPDIRAVFQRGDGWAGEWRAP
ncbi:MAG: hypothetical protein CSA72_02990 [Rhodobacterales bacterium]|nr:MAG: hypothetical protein CSA72_02990 [Rhodobacterales bacterium]